MGLTKLESELKNLESPYAISYNKLMYLREKEIDVEKLSHIIPDKKRLSAILQLIACDLQNEKKLFTIKDEPDGFDTEIKINGKIYDSPYFEKSIPTETIIYYSRYNNYKYAPQSSNQLYNDIVRFANEDLAKAFLREKLLEPNLNMDLLFNDIYDHLKSNHMNTDYENISRVISEQKPGASLQIINIPTIEEFIKQTGEEYNEDKYIEFINNYIEEKEGIMLPHVIDYARETISYNIDEILFWIRNPNHEDFEKNGSGDANEISIKYDIRKSPNYKGTEENPEYIGSGYDLSFREKQTTVLKIPIRKDKFAPFGFSVKTIYPDILDREATFTGKVFDLEEADYIGYRIALENSFNNKQKKKIEAYIKEVEGRTGKKLSASEKDLIANSENVKLTEEEKEKIINKVNETYKGISYIKSPMYHAFAELKESFTDKKIVTFFGNFKDTYRIEITPEKFANRIAHKFHRCVIVYDREIDKIRCSFFETEKAAGFDGRNKIKFDDLTEEEKEFFNACINKVNNELQKAHENEKISSEKIQNHQEEQLIRQILSGQPVVDITTSTDSEEPSL